VLRTESTFLTIPETADLLRTSCKAIYCMIARDQLAGVTRIGRRVLVNRDALLRSLTRGTVRADEKAATTAGK
jgi:excisionase family DNA binding protein